MRRAKWTLRAGEPKTLFGWCWRNLVHEGGALTLAMYAWVAASMTFFSLPWGASLAAFGFILYGGLRALLRRDELKTLLADPSPAGQFRASVVYRRNGSTLGRDDLALTVVDGWLLGEGVRAHFAIRPKDALEWDLTCGRGVVTRLTDGTEIDMSWTGEENGRLISAWRWSDGPASGESTFPPAQAHPQQVARTKAWIFGGLALAFGVRGAASWLHLWPREKDLVVAIMLTGLGVALVSCQKWGRLVDIDHAAERLAALPEQAPAVGGDLPFEETKVRT